MSDFLGMIGVFIVSVFVSKEKSFFVEEWVSHQDEVEGAGLLSATIW